VVGSGYDQRPIGIPGAVGRGAGARGRTDGSLPGGGGAPGAVDHSPVDHSPVDQLIAVCQFIAVCQLIAVCQFIAGRGVLRQ